MSTRVIQRNEEENILIHNYSLLLLFAWIPTSVYKINSNELILLWRWKNTTVFLRDFLYNWINVNNINQHIEHHFRLCLFFFCLFYRWLHWPAINKRFWVNIVFANYKLSFRHHVTMNISFMRLPSGSDS